MNRQEDDMQAEGWLEKGDGLDGLFAQARQLSPEDLGAADRFLATRRVARKGQQRHALRLWASAALGLAAALGGLTLLRPISPAELPSSAAYSVYQSALGEGW
jgi:hypothetical protein